MWTSVQPLFYAAAHGNLTSVKCLLDLGSQVNWRDSWRETALLYGITNFHTEVVSFLIEHGASVLVQSNNQTPQALLTAQSRPMPETRKHPRPSPTPQSSCPAAAARSRLAIVEWQKEDSVHEPIIEKSQHNVVVENQEYWVCESVKNCAKRLRRSEREFAVDHANRHSEMPWCQNLTAKDAANLVSVVVDDNAEDNHVAGVEELLSAFKPSSFT